MIQITLPLLIIIDLLIIISFIKRTKKLIPTIVTLVSAIIFLSTGSVMLLIFWYIAISTYSTLQIIKKINKLTGKQSISKRFTIILLFPVWITIFATISYIFDSNPHKADGMNALIVPPILVMQLFALIILFSIYAGTSAIKSPSKPKLPNQI